MRHKADCASCAGVRESHLEREDRCVEASDAADQLHWAECTRCHRWRAVSAAASAAVEVSQLHSRTAMGVVTWACLIQSCGSVDLFLVTYARHVTYDRLGLPTQTAWLFAGADGLALWHAGIQRRRMQPAG